MQKPARNKGANTTLLFRAGFCIFRNPIVEEFLDRIPKKAKIANKIPNHFQLSRDPKDEKYINLAVEAEADYIVRRDNDLLYLMTGTDVESKECRQRLQSLKIVEPIEFLRIVQEKI